MATHKAVITTGPGTPLQLIDVVNAVVKADELEVLVEWTASTPLDMNQAIGGLLVNPPQTLGDGDSGTVLSIGPDVKNFSVGDQVFGFTWRSAQEKAHQERIVAPEFLWAKIPDGFEAKEVVAVPNNFVTAFSSLMRDLRQELPWPKPEGYESKDAGKVFLIWGGSSSVGQYTIQILKYYGYEKIIATGSTKHHELLESLGATALVDYKNADVVEQIWKTANGTVDFVVDCIGSLEGSVRPISKLAKEGAIVAIMLPVILKDATATEKPEYEMDVAQLVPWKTGVEAKGVRTHFYLDNVFLAKHLQTNIMPAMLKSGAIKPNKIMIVEGKTLLERAENALDLLKRKVPSAERLVWRVSE